MFRERSSNSTCHGGHLASASPPRPAPLSWCPSTSRPPPPRTLPWCSPPPLLQRLSTMPTLSSDLNVLAVSLKIFLYDLIVAKYFQCITTKYPAAIPLCMKTWFWEYGEPISHLCSYLPTANKYHKRISIALSWVQEMTTMCKFHQEHEWWKIAMSFCFRATIISILTEGAEARLQVSQTYYIQYIIGLDLIHLYIISLDLAYL